MDAESIRGLVKANPPTDHGYDDQVKIAVARYAARRRAEGCTWATVATETGVSTTSARAWISRLDDATGFDEVAIVADPVPLPQEQELTLTSPSGFVVTGATPDQVAQILAVVR